MRPIMDQKAGIMKALAVFSIVFDCDEVNGRLVDQRYAIKLYKETGGLIWRMGGEAGDECETLPRPKTVTQAKRDARDKYQYKSAWKMRDKWT